jgi:hypothetical protein
MSILVPFLAVALLGCLGLVLALAFSRAVLYANVLTELDCVHEFPARLRSRRRGTAPALGGTGPRLPALDPRGPALRTPAGREVVQLTP